MAKRIYFDEHIEYLREIAPGKSSYEITELFNTKFGMNATRSAVRSLLTKHKIRTGAPKGNPKGAPSKVFPREIKDYMHSNYKGVGPKDMAQALNEKFGTNYTNKQVSTYYKNHGLNSGITGYFPKGQPSWNKGKKGYMGANRTSFKKGNIPPNRVPIGTERIDSKDGYIYVKIQDGHKNRNWKQKHILIWEHHHGEVPEGHVIIFGDGNKRNFDINNLVLVSRKQLLGLNKHDLIQNHADLTKTAVKVVDLQWKASERASEIRRSK